MLRLSSGTRAGCTLLLLPLLVACASSVVSPQAARPGPQAQLRASGDSAEPTSQPPAETPGPGAWWTAFADPQLDRLIEQALRQSPDVQAARQRLQAARALRPAADAAHKPELFLRSGAVATPDSRSGWLELGFDARWEQPLFGRDLATQTLAQIELDQAETALDQARLSLAAELARAWLEWRHELNRAAGARLAVDSEQQQLRGLMRRAELGLIADSAILPQQQRLATAQDALRQIEQLLPLQRQRVQILLGDLRAELPAPAPAGGSTPAALDSVPTAWLLDHPSLRRAEQRLRQAAAQAGLAEADRWPRLALAANLGVALPVLGRRAGNDPIPMVALGPLIDIPLLDAGRRRAVVTARDHELQAAVLEQRQAVLQAQADVEAALLRLQHSQERRLAAERGLLTLDAQARGLSEKARIGLSAAAPDPELERAHQEAREQSRNARLAQELAYLALFKALGHPLPEPEPAPAPAATPEVGG